ncbi:MAG: glycosyltransferase family A protein [Patescibacteria group bacterium]
MNEQSLKPKVSVLLTAYNNQAYIKQAIESILNQTFSEFEFIIIDDASTDNTWAIISDYAAKDLRIRIYKNGLNLGISKNRNRLISLARGEYIVWQDADDISLPNRLANQVSFMQSQPEVAISGGYLQFFNETQGNLSIRKYAVADKELRAKIFRYSPLAQPSAIVRKDALVKIGGYDETLAVAEDLDVVFRIGQDYKFANLAQVLVLYRQQSQSITFKKLKILELNTLKIRFHFVRNKSYKPNFFDILYNLGQFLTLYLLPAKFRVKIFDRFRNQKIYG